MRIQDDSSESTDIITSNSNHVKIQSAIDNSKIYNFYLKFKYYIILYYL